MAIGSSDAAQVSRFRPSSLWSVGLIALILVVNLLVEQVRGTRLTLIPENLGKLHIWLLVLSTGIGLSAGFAFTVERRFLRYLAASWQVGVWLAISAVALVLFAVLGRTHAALLVSLLLTVAAVVICLVAAAPAWAVVVGEIQPQLLTARAGVFQTWLLVGAGVVRGCGQSSWRSPGHRLNENDFRPQGFACLPRSARPAGSPAEA